jgi:hypothetical protein
VPGEWKMFWRFLHLSSMKLSHPASPRTYFGKYNDGRRQILNFVGKYNTPPPLPCTWLLTMDLFPNEQNVDLDKNFITAWKSITKLVIFRSFVAKCCKMRIIYSLAKFAVFQSFCITHGKLTAQSGVGASISRL